EVCVDKYDASASIFRVNVTPDVPISPWIRRGTARFLKPRVLIGGVVQHHLDDHANPALMGRLEKYLEIIESAVAGVNRTIVGDLVCGLALERREEWHQTQG